uniref:Fibronectin type III domain containing protein n=1 Tax=Echinococcus granulosus TaxID=6210 RepID=A0A068WP84_ECHGR|nr:Fibronectin type III domain containing protein [Echinococcus granulosus]
MLEGDSQESNNKSSFFSRPPQYPLEFNSVYRPKFSNLMADKPFTKPFYVREERRSAEKNSLLVDDDSLPLKEMCNVDEQKLASSIDRNINPPVLTFGSEAKGGVDGEKVGQLTDEGADIDVLVNSPPSENVPGPIENQSIRLSENEGRPQLPSQNYTFLTETDSVNASDMSPFNGSIIPQASEPNRLCESNNITLSLLELPSSVYVPPSYPVPSVILSHSVAAFPSIPVESLVTPMLTPQVFLQGQQHRKPFSTSKNKSLNSMLPAFQENSLYGLGVPQNGINKEYYVMVHVEAGATFSIRTGDQEQQIPGPATVRLVLNNGPPLPMPMQVPPGHLVQQIVDEDGVLTHVILSPIVPYSSHKAMSSSPTCGGASPLTRPSPSVAGSFSGVAPRLPAWPSRLRATGGVNVIISPKTSPGLAVAGPTWPAHARPVDMPLVQPPPPLHQPQLQHQLTTDVLSPPNETVTPLLEQRRKVKQERQFGGKMDTLEETPDKSPLASASASSSTLGQSKKQSTSGKKKATTNIGAEGESSKSRAKKSRKVSSVETTVSVPPLIPEEIPKTGLICNRGGQENLREAQKAPSQPKISALLRDDYSSLTFDETDGKAVVESASGESNGTASVDTSLSQRTARPVNVVRPTNGGRLLSAINGDLTPAEACELKASLGRVNGKPLNPSSSPAVSSPVKVANQPDNVWTARKLAALGGHVETPAATTTTTVTTGKFDRIGEKPKHMSSSTISTTPTKSTTVTPATAAGKQGVSENRKKASKNGEVSKPKGNFESNSDDKKTPKKDQQQNSGTNTLSSTAAPNTNAIVTTTLDVTETATTFLPNTTQHPYYSAPPFCNTATPHPSPFFPAPPHTHFGPPPPPPPSCFMPPPPPHHSPVQPPPPYLFSSGNPTAVVAGAPYLSFQLPPPPITHGLPSPLHPTTGAVPTGAPLLGVPHTLPFVTPTTAAAAAGTATIGIAEDERSTIIRVLSKIAPPKISSVDSRSVTINISIPENLCIDEQPLNSTGEIQKPPSNVTSKKGGKSDRADNEDRGEDTSAVKSTTQESSVTTVDATNTPPISKSWSIPPSHLRFALYLSERDENFVCVYVGEVTCILLQDLRPGVQYNIKVCCMYEGLCGTASESAEFVTLATEPSCPRPPNVFARTKSTLSVRWAVPADNGSKIISYCLQYATVTKAGGAPSFQICYTGIQRFHKLSHLLPATTYMLRVAAINTHGQSPWSDVVSVMTYGLPPSSPDPPRLLKATTHSLHLTWELQPTSHGSSSAPSKSILRYQLEMQEGEARQHFKKVYDDDATQYLVEGLRRCCLYRFRLAASNVDGTSHWSDIVAFRTVPDLPTAPKGLRLRGRVRPFHVNLCWSAPDDDGGMPVSAYRLEVLMPQLPTSLLRKYTMHQQQLQHQQHKKESLHYLHPAADSEEIKSSEIRGPICWPWVIASSDNNAFACVPPSTYVLQPPTSSIYSLGKVNDVPQLPFRVPSSASPINNPGERSGAAATSSLSFSESSDNEATDSACAWYAIYEGRCKEVTVCNLIPGQSFQFRVRASSHRATVSSQPHARTTSSSSVVPWGRASTSPLKVTTPAVPPINPPSNLRLFGRSNPTELSFTWDPPTSNGGAPILSYELWQSLRDPISGSPIKCTSWPKAPSFVMGITSSESMRDLHANVEPIPPSSSSVAAIAAGVLSAPGSVTSSPQHQTSIATPSRLVFAGVENSCEVRGLHSGQLFAFRVRARNSTGWSEWSEWSTFATAPSPPSAPGAPPRVKPTSATSVLVSWEEVGQTNGASITEYRVEWQPRVDEPSQTCTPSGREHDEEILLLTTETNNVSGSRNPSSCSPSMGISKCLNDGFQLVYSGLERHFELHDLQPASRIAFRVRAVNAAGAGGWSPVGSCVMPAARPDQPSGLTLDSSSLLATPAAAAAPEAEISVGGVSMTTARLVWIAPFDNGCPITSYNLEVTRYTNGQTSTPALSTGTSHSHTVYLPLYVDGEDLIQAKVTESLPLPPPSLPPPPDSFSEEEAVRVERGGSAGEVGDRLNNGDCGDLRDVFCIPGPSSLLLQSSPVSASPSPLLSLGIDSGSGLSSNVSSESGHQHHYQHLHASVSKSLGLRVRHPPGAMGVMEYVYYTLTGLEIGAKYRVRVQALNAVGVSPFSGILHFSTLPPLPLPLTLCCVGTTASGIKLRWSSSVDSHETDEVHPKSKPSTSTNIKYILEMSKKPESKGWVTIFEGPQTSFKVRKLSEATRYYFRVAAVNISGKGAFSEVLHEKTAYSQPPPVEAPQVVDVSHTQCKLQWPTLNKMGHDPLIYLVQLTRVPGISSTTTITKTALGSSPSTESETVTTAGVLTEAWEGEEEAVTVYRGAGTSCTISNLASGTNYIARVCAIRCCQTEHPEQLPLSTSKAEVDQELVTLQTPLPASSSSSTCAKIMLIHGPFSVGTAFTTLPKKRTFVSELINFVLLRSTLVNCRATLPPSTTHSAQEKSPSPPPRRPSMLAVNHLIAMFQRLRAYAFFRHISGHSMTSSRERAQRRMACLFVIGFVLFTLLCAWFANQFLLKFSDDVSPAAKWPGGGGSLEDSSSSARAALYATRGRQYHQ